LPQVNYWVKPRRLNQLGEKIMGKGQNSKKKTKKEPLKTLKEKRQAKREKKNQKKNPEILPQ
jgi:hypothetical protein